MKVWNILVDTDQGGDVFTFSSLEKAITGLQQYIESFKEEDIVEPETMSLTLDLLNIGSVDMALREWNNNQFGNYVYLSLDSSELNPDLTLEPDQV